MRFSLWKGSFGWKGIYEFSIEENNIQLSDEGEWIYKQDDYIALNPKKWSIIRFNDVTHLKERE